MVLKLLLSLVYQVVKNSWLVATVVAKYFLIVLLAEAAWRRNGLREFRQEVRDASPLFISSIVILGTLQTAIGLDIEPVFSLFSQLVALVYFGYLFWDY